VTIIEAIKSGRRFRRPCFVKGLWYYYTDSSYQMYRSDNRTYQPDKEDILADDWIIESPAVTITKEQFYEACEQVMESYAKNMGVAMINAGPRFRMSINELAERLGLK
jgi:hypothetical protein